MIVHAYCSVQFSRQPEPQYLRHTAEKTQLKIKELRDSVITEKAFRFNNSMIYRIIDSLAEFHPNFRALKEVVLDSRAMAAASKIDLTRVKHSQTQNFYTHPAYIDAFCQAVHHERPRKIRSRNRGLRESWLGRIAALQML